MFTDIETAKLSSEFNTLVTLTNLYRKQLVMCEAYDMIEIDGVFQEVTYDENGTAHLQKGESISLGPDSSSSKNNNSDDKDSNNTSNPEKKGFFKDLGSKIWNAIKKFFAMIKNFFKKLFKKDDAAKVSRASNNIGDFFTNAPDKEIDALIEDIDETDDDGDKESGDQEEISDDTSVTEMFIGEASTQVTNLPKNTPKNDVAYLKKALYAMKTHRGFIVSRIHRKDYNKYANVLIDLVKKYTARMTGFKKTPNIDLMGLIKDSKSYRNKIKLALLNIAGATRVPIGGSFVSYKGYEEFYREIMKINADISASINGLSAAMNATEKLLKEWERSITNANDSKFGTGFVNKKYINASKQLRELYTTISDLVKDLAVVAKDTVAGTMKAEVEMVMRINNEIIQVQAKRKSSRTATDNENEDNNSQNQQGGKKKKKSAQQRPPQQQPQQQGPKKVSLERDPKIMTAKQDTGEKEFKIEGQSVILKIIGLTLDGNHINVYPVDIDPENGPLANAKNLDGSKITNFTVYMYGDGIPRTLDGAAYHMNGNFWPEKSIGKNAPRK